MLVKFKILAWLMTELFVSDEYGHKSTQDTFGTGILWIKIAKNIFLYYSDLALKIVNDGMYSKNIQCVSKHCILKELECNHIHFSSNTVT